MCQEYRCCLCSLWMVMYICVSGISMLSLFYVSGHVYMCQEYRRCLCSLLRGHVYVCQEYRCCLCTWPLTRNRENIDIPDRHIHDHSQGTETTSIFLTHISITKQQGTETISIFLTHIYMTTQQGIETTSIFLTHIYMTTHKEQRQHRYSWQTYTWPLTRNRDNIDIPDRHISLWVVMYRCVRNIDVVSIPCEWSCICVSGISMLSVPCEWSCTCLSGISMLSLFLVSGHVYVCQEYRCCLCSLWLVMYICVRNIAVVSVPCE
jgi:hypothetical protein